MRKRKWKLLGGLAAAAALASAAMAAPTEDSLTVTVTPNAVYSMTLSTANAANSFALGSVNLAASTYTVSPATVTITSSYATTGLTLQGIPAGGWTLETANTGNVTSEADKLAAWAVFTDTGVSLASTVQGEAGAFSGTAPYADASCVLSSGTVNVGTWSSGGKHTFVLTSGDANYKSMTNLPSNAVDAGGAASHLWLKLTLPGSTTSNTQKSLTVVVTAGAPAP